MGARTDSPEALLSGDEVDKRHGGDNEGWPERGLFSMSICTIWYIPVSYTLKHFMTDQSFPSSPKYGH